MARHVYSYYMQRKYPEGNLKTLAWTPKGQKRVLPMLLSTPAGPGGSFPLSRAGHTRSKHRIGKFERSTNRTKVLMFQGYTINYHCSWMVKFVCFSFFGTVQHSLEDLLFRSMIQLLFSLKLQADAAPETYSQKLAKLLHLLRLMLSFVVARDETTGKAS